MPLPRGRGRRALFAAVVLLGAAAAAVVLVSRALDSGALRSEAEARLSAMLGQPVTIGAMNIDLFPSPLITGTGITAGQPSNAPAPAIAIARIEIDPRLRSLFSGPVLIEEVRLDGLVVSVLRDRSGAWHVPSAIPAPTAGTEGGVVIERVRATRARVVVFDELAGGGGREASSIDDIDALVGVAKDGLRLSPVTGRIGNARIAGEARTDASAAHLEFRADEVKDDDVPALLGLIGAVRPDALRLPEAASAAVALRIDRATSQLSGQGTLSASHVRFEPLRLLEFSAPFTLANQRVVFEPTTFTLNGGTHRGAITVDTAGPSSRWGIESRVTKLDVGSFLDALAGADARIDGSAAATASLRGRLDEALATTVNGRVQLTIDHGVIHQFPLLAAINSAVQLTAGDTEDTRFERLSATLALSGGRARTDNLVMEAGHVRVAVAGTIGFNRALDMKGKAVLSAERAAAAIRSVHELTGLRNKSGELELPITISGTLDSPSFAVDMKAVIGKGIQDELMRRLRRIIKQ